MVIILPKVSYHLYSNWGRIMMYDTWKIDANIWWVNVKRTQLLGSPGNVIVFKVRVFISSLRYCFFNNETQKILHWSMTDIKWYHRWPKLHFWWENMYFLPFLPLPFLRGWSVKLGKIPFEAFKGRNGKKCVFLHWISFSHLWWYLINCVFS